MRLSMKHLFFALIVLSAFAYYSCEKGTDPLAVQLSTMPQEATSEGNTLTFLNGNVTLNVHPGAVSEAVLLSVSECPSGVNCNFALKAISIEPLVSFNEPIYVSLKYDGELANTKVDLGGCSLCIYSWEKPESLYNGEIPKMCCCCIDENNKTINFQISQTGVFAVGSSSLMGKTEN